MVYNLGATSIWLPDHWEDKTIIAFSAPAKHPEHVPENVVINRDQLAIVRGGQLEDFDNYIERQINALEDKIPQFRRLTPEFIVENHPARREIAFVWRTAQTTLRQSMIVTHYRPPDIATLTFTCHEREFSQLKPEFEAILKSIDLSRFE